jgi:hypothetical protein
MELIQSKSLLAKLMATENLTIEQRKVQTACFDVQNRVLVVPMLDKNISGQLYDLFMGHEVGHALYTPLEGLQEAKKRKLSLSVANVVEDARIERKIKSKYPGIRSSFIKGYNELISKDFFGTNGFDLNDMNFIDRANLFFKGGAQQGIRFNEVEKLLVQDIETTESYDDVLTVTKKVMEYLKTEKEEKSKNHIAPKADEEDDDEDDYDPHYGDIEDIDGESDDDYDEDFTPPEDDGEDKNGSNDSAGETTKGSGEEQEIESETDKNYHRNESKLFADDSRSYYYGNIPEIEEHYIVSYKKLWPRYRRGMEDVSLRYCDDKHDNLGIRPETYKKVRNDAKKIVSYLAKEFEMRKNADQLKRATVAKTGDLNMSKLFSYKFNEDIFKKISVIPGGKSHGLVMFIDWSGSMTEHLDNTVKQLINLTMFCKKVNIPFEVYAFTQSYWDEEMPKKFQPSVGDIKIGDFRLMNVFSSKMSATEYSYACSAMLYMSELRSNRYRNSCPDFMELSGTPLNEAIIAAMEIIPKFQKQYKLQIVNTVFLTDGDGHRLTDVYFNTPHGILHGDANSYEESGYSHRRSRVFTIRDPKTRNEETITEFTYKKVTAAYLKLLKARTGCNVIGFYILSGRDFNKNLRDFYETASSLHIENIKSEFRKSKNHVITNAGYDEYYLIKSNSLDTDEDVEFEVKENATTRSLATAFSKFAGNRISNRIVLNRFIGMIA